MHKTALALVCLLLCASAARAQAQGPCPLPEPTGYYKYVSDFAGVIDPATKDRMSAMLNELQAEGQIEFAVVTVPTTGGQAPFDYSLAVARCWGIGSSEGEKNGMLLLVAVEDRKYQVQVSRHLEGDLPDGLVGEIGRRMREPFRRTPPDYNGGLMTAVQTLVATLEEKRGLKIEGTDPRYAYRPPARRTRERPTRGGGIGVGACCLAVVVLFIIFSMFSRGGRGGRRGGGGGWGGGGGLLNALILGQVLGQLGRGGSSSGWGGGGGSSGWGGGGGGGFGGFGGGGDFGGGGAGGSW